MKREVIIYKNHFLKFYKKQDTKTKTKIDYVLKIIRELDKIPEQFFKHLKELTGYMKQELSWEVIFIEYFAFLMTVI